MKNGKKLLLLLLVLAVLVGATAIVGTISKNAADQEDETQTVFSLDPENVTNLGWDYSEKVSFTAGEDGAIRTGRSPWTKPVLTRCWKSSRMWNPPKPLKTRRI